MNLESQKERIKRLFPNGNDAETVLAMTLGAAIWEILKDEDFAVAGAGMGVALGHLLESLPPSLKEKSADVFESILKAGLEIAGK